MTHLAMLYLAQVKKNLTSGGIELQLLAHQQSEHIWEVGDLASMPLSQRDGLSDGLLVLVDLGENHETLEIREAKDWVLNLVQQYLSNSAITPEFVAQEQARIEKWRQELTTQNQDLTRLRLEIETRREQLQELEASLKEEKDKLKAIITDRADWQ